MRGLGIAVKAPEVEDVPLVGLKGRDADRPRAYQSRQTRIGDLPQFEAEAVRVCMTYAKVSVRKVVSVAGRRLEDAQLRISQKVRGLDGRLIPKQKDRLSRRRVGIGQEVVVGAEHVVHRMSPALGQQVRHILFKRFLIAVRRVEVTHHVQGEEEQDLACPEGVWRGRQAANASSTGLSRSE